MNVHIIEGIGKHLKKEIRKFQMDSDSFDDLISKYNVCLQELDPLYEKADVLEEVIKQCKGGYKMYEEELLVINKKIEIWESALKYIKEELKKIK